jgi:hypothetical protein
MCISGKIISVKEALLELRQRDHKPYFNSWINDNKSIFKAPKAEEMSFVREMFEREQYRQLIALKNILEGAPVADPFIIASAKIKGGIVVTEEKYKKNGVKIPNICGYYKIECIDMEEFLDRNQMTY